MEHAYAYGLYEVVKYGVDVHILGITALLAMNYNKWNKIPSDCQKIMLDTGRQLTFHTLEGIAQNRFETMKKVQASGVEMYNFPKSELEKWANLPDVKNMMNVWIKDNESKGLPGERVMNKFIQLMK